MRYLIMIAALCAFAGCAGQPPATSSNAGTTTASAEEVAKTAKPKVIPERVKGPYKVVMRGDQKLYCTRELATGSRSNFRNICMTPEEWAETERRSRDWKDSVSTSVVPPDRLP
jgi:hypothetical protein